MPAAAASTVRLRADAARNRQTIIDSARVLYGQRGLDTPFDEIARHAGIGNATLYRHFPTRCDLAVAVFADTLRRVVDAAERALADSDAWAGFTSHVRFLFRLQATDRGLADLLTTTLTGAPEIEQLRERAYRLFVKLAARAKAAGELRADFEPADVVMLLMANAGLVHRTAGSAPTAWNRFADIAIDGLRSAAATDSTGPRPRTAAVRRAMRTRGEQLGYH